MDLIGATALEHAAYESAGRVFESPWARFSFPSKSPFISAT